MLPEDYVEWWFNKNNYMSKYLSEDSRRIAKEIKEKHRLAAIEAAKPKPRKKRK